MNKREFKGFGTIFSFTLNQQFRSKKFLSMTLVIAFICFLLPAAIIPIFEVNNAEETAFASTTTIETVYVVDNTTTTPVDFNILNQLGNETFSNITYEACSSVEDAASLAEGSDKALILVLDQNEGSYKASLLSSENTDLESYEKDALLSFIKANMQTILIYKSGIPYEALAEMTLPINTVLYQGGEAPVEEDPLESVKYGLSMVLPYLNLMLIYLLVLFYGQNVANVIIIEKSSKLMDTFLVSVKPSALIFGKAIASITAYVLQFGSWLLSLFLGFVAGLFITEKINPSIDSVIMSTIESLKGLSGMFTIPSIILAILMIILAFFLYCSLAAIGGALAGKPEDLSSTNTLFVMILLVSFFALIYSGAVTGNMEAALAWYDIVPFTAAIITSSKILLGYLTGPQLVLCFGTMLISIFIFLYLAGRIYKMMSLYKGNVPKPDQLLKMMTNK